ncbi:MAG TPA: pyrimidine reductase family protein [Microbacteriaceae bacterium]|nr:pyrimidine reductase family protein [Microbacteriaceae bacterium]
MTGTEPAAIDRLWPAPATALDDDTLAEGYEAPRLPWLRVNFVASLDGSAARDGRSGGLSDAADRRVFATLRRLCDVVVVGAGTVRAEGYGGMRVDEATAAWRSEHGRAPQPRLAIVTNRLHLSATDAALAEAVARPIVITCASAPETTRRELSEVADVLICGQARVEPARLVAALAARGMPRMLCEGGPRLFGALAEAGVVDELCLTTAGVLVGGRGPRILHADRQLDLSMRLAHVLAAGETLLTRYVRAPSSASSAAASRIV